MLIEVVKNANIVTNLADTLEDIIILLAQSARVRRVSLPIEPITKVATNILAKIQKSNQKIVILFGIERIVLLNEELLMINVYYDYIPSKLRLYFIT